MALAPKYRNWLRTLGAPEDPVATDTTSEWSLVSLVKALYQKVSDGSFAAAVTGRAEGLVSICQGAAALCAHYVRLARASKIAAAASAGLTAADVVTTNANVVLTAADAATTAAQTALAIDANNFARGTALFGQRAKKDRVAAAASAVAAAASAASVPAIEALPLPMQIYS